MIFIIFYIIRTMYMEVQKQYGKIVHLKEILKASPTVSSFLETSQQELFSVLDKPFL